ncbi:hypothetical protein HKX48_007076 [Thoreauomyces humboldtii]|nr:hypothetical protein HKX48_007076 [Thoreauomyces humboldtii]
MYVFGGLDASNTTLSDLWTIDLTPTSATATARGFRELFAAKPPARTSACLAPISATTVMLFGGRGAGGAVLGDVWIYDANADAWTEATLWFATGAPGARAGMSCDWLGGLVWLYGGIGSDGGFLDDLWTLDASNWQWAQKGIGAGTSVVATPVASVLPSPTKPSTSVAARVTPGPVTAPLPSVSVAPALPIATPRPVVAPPVVSATPSGASPRSGPTPPVVNPAVPTPLARRAVLEAGIASASPSPSATPAPRPIGRAFHQSTIAGTTYLLITGGATAFNGTSQESFPSDPRVYIYDTLQDIWIQDVRDIPAGALARTTATPGPGGADSSGALKKYALIAAAAFLGAVVGIVGCAVCYLRRSRNGPAGGKQRRYEEKERERSPSPIVQVLSTSSPSSSSFATNPGRSSMAKPRMYDVIRMSQLGPSSTTAVVAAAPFFGGKMEREKERMRLSLCDVESGASTPPPRFTESHGHWDEGDAGHRRSFAQVPEPLLREDEEMEVNDGIHRHPRASNMSGPDDPARPVPPVRKCSAPQTRTLAMMFPAPRAPPSDTTAAR